MVINYFGERCFRLQSGEVSLLADPASNRLKADVVLRTLTPTSLAPFPAGDISFPGEYEVHGMEVIGFPVPGESTGKFIKTVYHVQWEGMSFVFLGHVVKIPESEWFSKIGEADVLFLPLDGESYLSPENASAVVRELAPKMTIVGETKNMPEMLRALGRKAESQDKLVFKRKDIEGEEGKVIVLRAA